MMKNIIAFIKEGIIFALIIGVIAVIAFVIFSFNSPLKDSTKYDCDVKVVSLNTKVEVSKNDEKYATISGDVFRVVEDPLQMTKDGNQVAYAGDDYQFIDQDDHAIYVNGSLEVKMDGKFKLFGQAYDLYDKDGHLIGTAEFAPLNFNGHIYDIDGNEIARYNRKSFFKDYTSYIKENDILSDDAILMIFASSHSDESYDNRNR